MKTSEIRELGIDELKEKIVGKELLQKEIEKGAF